jgi:hypothetical protein
MTENEIGTIIVDTAIALDRDLGLGLLETVMNANSAICSTLAKP